jgi:predicted acylesterase/phospholipase RssA
MSDKTAMTPSRGGCFLLLAALAALLTGCNDRPDLPNSAAPYAEPGAIPHPDRTGHRPLADFEASVMRALETDYPLGDSNRNGKPDYLILALSGGGGYGAFSAGILDGWSETGTRPEFDVVTGVSTGALAGALAFAGPEWDPVLKHVYTELAKEDLFRIRMLGGFFSTSVADVSPLQQQIEAIVDERFLEVIVREHRKGRRFYVVTTDLDRDRMTIWDMGVVAMSQDPQHLERFRSILLASASFPVFFPPVYISTTDGGAAMHVDGGLKAPILVESFMFEAARRLSSGPLNIEVWALVNDKLLLQSEGNPTRPNLAAIATSSLRALYHTATMRALEQVYVDTRRADAAFWLAHIPDEFQLSGSAMAFDNDDMQRLYGLGETLARSNDLWERHPPAVEPR